MRFHSHRGRSGTWSTRYLSLVLGEARHGHRSAPGGPRRHPGGRTPRRVSALLHRAVQLALWLPRLPSTGGHKNFHRRFGLRMALSPRVRRMSRNSDCEKPGFWGCVGWRSGSSKSSPTNSVSWKKGNSSSGMRAGASGGALLGWGAEVIEDFGNDGGVGFGLAHGGSDSSPEVYWISRRNSVGSPAGVYGSGGGGSGAVGSGGGLVPSRMIIAAGG